jgi:hypothetical protein
VFVLLNKCILFSLPSLLYDDNEELLFRSLDCQILYRNRPSDGNMGKPISKDSSFCSMV